MAVRKGVCNRNTSETQIQCEINLDGTGNATVDTGIGFFDHMLKSFAKHGLFDLKIKVKGDLFVDSKRYGFHILPMDEALVLCALDLSNRPYLVYNANLTTNQVGYMDTEMVKEFFYAISYSAGMNLHIKQLDGSNNHHIMEAMFKAFARALDEASRYDERVSGILSTKGSL